MKIRLQHRLVAGLKSRTAFFALMAGLLAVTADLAAQRGNPKVQFEGRSIDDMIGDFMEQHQIPGMTLAIVQAPYIPRAVGYGVSDAEKRLLASPKTLWNVGQMTQAYTAVAIMQLVEAGTLSLDEGIGKHVASAPREWQAITVRQLLGHASGLSDYTKQPAFKADSVYTPAQIVDLVKDKPLAFTPGTRVAASATNFFLLGLVVEHASGMPYDAFVMKHQIEKLGLKNTVFASGFSRIEREAVEKNGFRHRDFLRHRPFIDPSEVATGYTVKDGVLAGAARNSQSAWYGNGSIYASAEDISLWDVGLAGELLVSKKEHRDILYRGVALADGTVVPGNAGWRFPAHKGLMDIKGNVPGFSCYLSRFTDPSELLCVTLCANKDGVDLAELARRVAGAFDRKLGPPAAARGLYALESAYSAAATAERFGHALDAGGVRFAASENGEGGMKIFEVRHGPGAPVQVRVWTETDGTVWIAHQPVSDQAATAALSAAFARATGPY